MEDPWFANMEISVLWGYPSHPVVILKIRTATSPRLSVSVDGSAATPYLKAQKSWDMLNQSGKNQPLAFVNILLISGILPDITVYISYKSTGAGLANDPSQARKDLVIRRIPTVKLKMNIECLVKKGGSPLDGVYWMVYFTEHP